MYMCIPIRLGTLKKFQDNPIGPNLHFIVTFEPRTFLLRDKETTILNILGTEILK